MFDNQPTKVKGTITEEHEGEIREIFGDKLADKVKDAPEGSLFLNLLWGVES